jgi:hypothetical protein
MILKLIQKNIIINPLERPILILFEIELLIKKNIILKDHHIQLEIIMQDI